MHVKDVAGRTIYDQDPVGAGRVIHARNSAQDICDVSDSIINEERVDFQFCTSQLCWYMYGEEQCDFGEHDLA